MTETELAALIRLVDDLNESTSELNDRSVDQTKVQVELRRQLAAVERKLPEFVPKKRFRWIIAGVILAVLAAVLIGLVFRVQDSDEAERRRAQLVHDDEQDRQNLLRGCERGNDQRGALRRVIERGYTPTPIPEGLTAELRDLIIQSQERLAILRAEQLADPGVQPIDCAAQFPPAPPREKA